MKKIQLSQGTIRVDETALLPKNTATFVYNSYSKSINDYYATEELLAEGIWLIIASSFPIDKDLPMYKEEEAVEELAEKIFEIVDIDCRMNLTHPAKQRITLLLKAAKSKGCYTEDDLRKAIDLARGITDGKENFDVESISGLTETDTYGWKVENTEDEIIQSIKDKQEEFEMEDE